MCLISLVITQVKGMGYHYTPVRNTKIKTPAKPRADAGAEQPDLSYIAGRNVTLENSLAGSDRQTLTTEPSNCVPYHLSKKKHMIHKNLSKRVCRSFICNGPKLGRTQMCSIK